MEKEYKILFTSDYKQYKEWATKRGGSFWESQVDSHPEQLALCEKYSGKTVKLSDIPAFVEEVGECVIGEDTIEVYNDYRE